MKIAIIGANGIVGETLTHELLKRNDIEKLVLAARSYIDNNQHKISYRKIDALNRGDIEKLLDGIDIAYLTIGLPYSTSVWQKDWPVIIKNVLDGCEKNKTKFVFFDNVYAYGLVKDVMTEDTPLNPCSKKGIVRKQLQNIIEEYSNNGKVVTVIAKSADYYGPGAKSSLFYVNNIENLLKNKKPAWLGNPETLHSFTFLPDAAKALIELGMDKKADNQVWHLPTAEPLICKEYLKYINEEFNKPNKYSSYNKLMMKFVGLFNPLVKELIEMFYQFENDYKFSSKKFEKSFKTKPTPYKEGIKKMVGSFKT